MIRKCPRNMPTSGTQYQSCQFWWYYDCLFPIYGLLGVACIDCLALSINRVQLQTAAAYMVKIGK